MNSAVGEQPAPLGNGVVVASKLSAICVRIGRKRVWLPRSALHSSSEIGAKAVLGASGMVVVELWLARRRGWA